MRDLPQEVVDRILDNVMDLWKLDHGRAFAHALAHIKTCPLPPYDTSPKYGYNFAPMLRRMIAKTCPFADDVAWNGAIYGRTRTWKIWRPLLVDEYAFTAGYMRTETRRENVIPVSNLVDREIWSGRHRIGVRICIRQPFYANMVQAILHAIHTTLYGIGVSVPGLMTTTKVTVQQLEGGCVLTFATPDDAKTLVCVA
jgi:hypothetical protein